MSLLPQASRCLLLPRHLEIAPARLMEILSNTVTVLDALSQPDATLQCNSLSLSRRRNRHRHTRPRNRKLLGNKPFFEESAVQTPCTGSALVVPIEPLNPEIRTANPDASKSEPLSIVGSPLRGVVLGILSKSVRNVEIPNPQTKPDRNKASRIECSLRRSLFHVKSEKNSKA